MRRMVQMKLAVYICFYLPVCAALCATLQPAQAETSVPSPSPSWVDIAPTEPLGQYGRWARELANSDVTAVLKFERVSSHNTRNYPLVIQSLAATSPSGHSFQTKPLSGFDGTTNLLGTDSFRSNMTFAQDLAVYVQGRLKLTKRAPFSPRYDGIPWKQVQGGTVKATADFETVAASLTRSVGIRKTVYPHPVSSFGEVSVHDLNILTGRVHFVVSKGARLMNTPVIVTFDYAVKSESGTRKESTVVQACSARSVPLKLPSVPFGGEAELLTYSVVEDRTAIGIARCT